METIASKVILIGIVARAYDFTGEQDGKQHTGTSYKATVSAGGQVFVMKCDETVFKDVGAEKNVEGDATIEITASERKANKGEIQLFLKEFNYK